MDAGLGLLDKPGESRFVVQLMMTDARQADYLEWYVGEAYRTLAPDALFLYPSGNAESPKMGVLYGAFPTRREANDGPGRPAGQPAEVRPVRADDRRGAKRREKEPADVKILQACQGLAGNGLSGVSIAFGS
ncbi:MAG: hypothetical protein IPJ28_04140 [Betaproteobacteria bacterium]|nr:hypothetical protein [Betaproteobacteria bacterium]